MWHGSQYLLRMDTCPSWGHSYNWWVNWSKAGLNESIFSRNKTLINRSSEILSQKPSKEANSIIFKRPVLMVELSIALYNTCFKFDTNLALLVGAEEDYINSGLNRYLFGRPGRINDEVNLDRIWIQIVNTDETLLITLIRPANDSGSSLYNCLIIWECKLQPAYCLKYMAHNFDFYSRHKARNHWGRTPSMRTFQYATGRYFIVSERRNNKVDLGGKWTQN